MNQERKNPDNSNNVWLPSLQEYREALSDALTAQYVQNALSLEQYESAMTEVQAAHGLEELKTVAQAYGLPSIHGNNFSREALSPHERSDWQRAVSQRNPASVPYREDAFHLCIMGDRRIVLGTEPARSATSFTLMGSTKIDLSEANIPPEGLHLEVIAVMGETVIIVPPDIPVKMSVVPIMGEAVVRRGVLSSVPVRADRERDTDLGQLEISAGTIEISGLALMGSVSVRTPR
ncbi:MAG: LiaF domain-containing protein [Rectinemataceae bacterium]